MVMVRVRVWVRVRVAARAVVAFSVATQFTVPTGKRQWTPERNAIGSHACKSFKRTCMGSNGILESVNPAGKKEPHPRNADLASKV
jgi:hypothetical protein